MCQLHNIPWNILSNCTHTLLEVHVIMFTVETVFLIIGRPTMPIPLTQQSDILKAGALKIKITCMYLAHGVGVDEMAVISSSGC